MGANLQRLDPPFVDTVSLEHVASFRIGGKIRYGLVCSAVKVMAEEDDDQTMELTIEALTGTVYDLCVSPYETILGIKMKIQRLEGKKRKPSMI